MENVPMNASEAIDRIAFIARFGGEIANQKKDNEATEFIRRAVNSHDPLVKALEALTAAATTSDIAFHPANVNARAALAEAKGVRA